MGESFKNAAWLEKWQAEECPPFTLISAGFSHRHFSCT
jgi:hypothetical protein